MDGRAAGRTTGGKEKRGRKKGGSGGGRKGNTDIRRRKGSGGWSSAHIRTADTYTTGTSMYVRTYVYMYIYIVEDAGDHACARAYVRASYVRSFYYPRTPGSRLMLHNIGRHHWSKPGGINLNVF